MLQPVSLGHHRSICPGLALDGRGISLGRQLAIFFPDLAGVKAFFATATHETSFEPILPSLEIVRSVDHQDTSQWMVRFDVSDSYHADPFAQWARMFPGQVFSGSGAHLVPYRDQKGPTGYDLEDAATVVRGASGLVLYTHAGVRERHLKNSESLLTLALNLPLVALSPTRQKRKPDHVAFLVPKALRTPFFHYCQDRGVIGHVLSVTAEKESLFAGGSKSFYLVNCESVSGAMLDLMAALPGVEVLSCIARNVFVSWPYAHPFALESLAPIFKEDRLFIFSQAHETTSTFAAFDDPVDLSHFTGKEFSAKRRLQIHERTPMDRNLSELSIPIALTQNHAPRPHVDAVLIPTDRLPWVQSLLYNLPRQVLAESKGVLTEAGLFIISPREAAHWPMGHFFQLVGADVYLPWGYHWVPRVSPEDFRASLDIDDALCCFVSEDESIQLIAKKNFEELSRSVLAPFTVQHLELMSLDDRMEFNEPEIAHLPQSRFVLWRGMKWDNKEAPPALPEKAKAESPSNGDSNG